MTAKCPKCQVRLRLPQKMPPAGVQVCCPRCQAKFKVSEKKNVLLALIAHEDPQICQLLAERIEKLGGCVHVCSNEQVLQSYLQNEQRTILLLDVAFGGTFPFLLIDQITSKGNERHKVILLPSVYNHTAYKKRPDSLYGADAYLELHHIGYRLLPLLGDLFPELSTRLSAVEPVKIRGDERSLQQDVVAVQAGKLAKILVADIILYHQDRLEEGLASGQVEQLFSEQLDEGRRMLQARLPATADMSVDYIKQAFDAACQSYSGS